MTERHEEGKALDLRLTRVIRNMVSEFYGSLESEIRGYGLSLETFRILEFLYSKGPHPVQKISDTFAIPSGSITYVVDKLEKQGYVERQPIPGDRRKTNVALTGEGRSYFDTIFPKHVATITDHLSDATDEEKRELIRVLKKIGYGIQQRRNGAIGDGAASNGSHLDNGQHGRT
ncbi:MarR family transcriptional regulator, 2-MHQ and catechol-resistance regulon repressor [Paenibacillus sp. UNC496MF]|uniref:MarR family winged helix-turn-helix transcriptional regulator n=1 Tax=Paenibacillus sp. UNC496MF TaxID=1502753 RepID=UPI0008F2C77F|nr:MarR family transcriptional regulator [Paenibacillus sp. UNC496MF]SFI40637.1 MarR family transcriptional regulator, 2-MHQ and catechol-resistance regulon repressor [Paenibacillus sp. UNC496MF]